MGSRPWRFPTIAGRGSRLSAVLLLSKEFLHTITLPYERGVLLAELCHGMGAGRGHGADPRVCWNFDRCRHVRPNLKAIQTEVSISFAGGIHEFEGQIRKASFQEKQPATIPRAKRRAG